MGTSKHSNHSTTRSATPTTRYDNHSTIALGYQHAKGHAVCQQFLCKVYLRAAGHAHGIGVHSLIIDKCPTFTQIFLLWTECKRKQPQS